MNNMKKGVIFVFLFFLIFGTLLLSAQSFIPDNYLTRAVDLKKNRNIHCQYDEIEEIFSVWSSRMIWETNEVKIYAVFDSSESLPSPYLRIKIKYVDSNWWLRIEKYTIKTDSNTYTIIPLNLKRIVPTHNEVDAGSCVEIEDRLLVEDYDFAFLEDLINSKRVLIRYHGENKHVDRQLTKIEQQAMKDVYDIYRVWEDEFKKNVKAST